MFRFWKWTCCNYSAYDARNYISLRAWFALKLGINLGVYIFAIYFYNIPLFLYANLVVILSFTEIVAIKERNMAYKYRQLN